MFKLPNGAVVNFDQPFVIGTGDDAVTYPGNWLRQNSPDERAELGITEIQPQQRPNDRYFFVTDNGDGTYQAIARPVDQVKASLLAEVKDVARARLSATSWYIERLMDPTSSAKPIPQEVLDERAAIRERADFLEALIDGCGTVHLLSALSITWPEQELTQG